MVTAAGFVFWLASATLAWVYLGYPAAAALAARWRPFRLRPTSPGPSRVSVGIAAHDEADQLGARIANVLDQVVPFEIEVIVGSDGSTDGTARVVDALAADDPRIRLLDLPRDGQTATQNAIFEAARGAIVVLTDAETRFDPGCLAALVEPFHDPRVGCTTGRIRWSTDRQSHTSRSEGAYWRYEQAVRAFESRAGWLTAVTGALLAVRGPLAEPVPPFASMDHLLPLRARDAGQVVLAVADATASDRGIAGLEDQFRNRARTATRGIAANLSMAGRLTPWRRPSAALAIWSHKLLRWATPWLVGIAGLASLAVAAGGSRLAAVPSAVLGVAIAAAGAGLGLSRRGRPVPRPLSLALTIAVVNVAFVRGWLQVLRGRRIEAWHRTDWRSVGPSPAEPSEPPTPSP